MSETAAVTVKANQATTDWQDGAIFTVERTEYIDRLLANGILSELQYDDPEALVLLVTAGISPETALTDDDAKAAGFDLDDPDILPPATEAFDSATDPDVALAYEKSTDLTAEEADPATVAQQENVAPEQGTDDATPAETKPRAKRAATKKPDDVGE